MIKYEIGDIVIVSYMSRSNTLFVVLTSFRGRSGLETHQLESISISNRYRIYEYPSLLRNKISYD